MCIRYSLEYLMESGLQIVMGLLLVLRKPERHGDLLVLGQPVSYTHLDVYKRQLLRRGIFPAVQLAHRIRIQRLHAASPAWNSTFAVPA